MKKIIVLGKFSHFMYQFSCFIVILSMQKQNYLEFDHWCSLFIVLINSVNLKQWSFPRQNRNQTRIILRKFRLSQMSEVPNSIETTLFLHWFYFGSKKICCRIEYTKLKCATCYASIPPTQSSCKKAQIKKSLEAVCICYWSLWKNIRDIPAPSPQRKEQQ